MTTDHLTHDAALPRSELAHRGWPFQRPATARYGVAVGVVILAFALRYWIFGTLEHRFPFIFFVPAAMIAAWYGGMAPGLLATVAGLMLGDYFFLTDHQALGPVRESERISIGLYAVTTTLCVMLFENLHNRIRRLEHALERARHHPHTPHPGTDAPASSAVTPSPH
jgi:K+-sensing histidine kinase KdpD